MIKIINSKNEIEDFNPNKIVDKLKKYAQKYNLNIDEVAQKTISLLPQEVTTEQIDDLASSILDSYISQNPDYSRVAAALVADRIAIKVNKTFREIVQYLVDIDRVKQSILDKTIEFDLEKYIVQERDYDFDYFGISTLTRSYLLKVDGKIVETPQYMYMRVAAALGDTKDRIIELYNAISQKKISLASPILFNAGTHKDTMISCNLISHLGDETGDPDSKGGICATHQQAAYLSSAAAGIGLDITNIRSKKSFITSSGGHAAGLLKMVKPLNEYMRAFDQGGNRPGSAALYCEIWHKDITDILQLKLNVGPEELRARDLFTAVWMCDLFMEELEKEIKGLKSDWYLFCPADLKKNNIDLHTTFGDEFRVNYSKAVELGLGDKTSALHLWREILNSQIKTGIPYITYKDAVNISNMQSNIGVIRQSNLCVAPETFLLTDKGYFKMEELEDKKVNIWNGEEWSETIVRKTSDREELFKISFHDGQIIHTTKEHKWAIIKSGEEIEVTTAELVKGNKLVQTEYPVIKTGRSDWGDSAYDRGLKTNPDSLDGLIMKGAGAYWFHKDIEVPYNHNIDERLEWLAGFFDSCHTSDSIYFMPIGACGEFRTKLCLLLNTLGVNARIRKSEDRVFSFLIYPQELRKLISLGLKSRTDILDKYIISDQDVPDDILKCKRVRFVTTVCRIDKTYCLTEPKKNRMLVNGVLSKNCNEIVQFTDEKTVANCVLSSVVVGNPIYIDRENKTIYWDKLEDSINTIVRTLNVICDINHYPTKETLKGGMEQRALAIGVLGLADLFHELDILFGSEESIKLSTRLAERMYYYSLKASMNLAKETQPYPFFKDSPYSKGILHFDKYKNVRNISINLDPELDWDSLREDIKEHGIANSLLCGYMPTASTSNLSGYNECFEPYLENLYTRGVKAGEYLRLNKHLVKDLQELGFWEKRFIHEFIVCKGDIKNIDFDNYWTQKTFDISKEKGEVWVDNRIKFLKEKHKLIWDRSMKDIINLAAARQPFIDQTQSMNLWIKDNDVSKLTSMYLYGWKAGLKTGVYYLRSEAASQANESLGVRKESDTQTKFSNDNGVSCEGCSA